MILKSINDLTNSMNQINVKKQRMKFFQTEIKQISSKCFRKQLVFVFFTFIRYFFGSIVGCDFSVDLCSAFNQNTFLHDVTNITVKYKKHQGEVYRFYMTSMETCHK